ncbi:ectonucleoside triphosphate diphosphohydrolase 5 isoform X2 [Venturia canescens]|uniref:ectonucleoside triphosphate diphosphohydrolase 5 isoform X2 n=1 Tax=Venturia canescens TaxID=32260 RepID=UPI001C9CC14D|nr:ectonucleoside triphosphate diphosphohydrolase 5 isoform X2 [Venturia canescens]
MKYTVLPKTEDEAKQQRKVAPRAKETSKKYVLVITLLGALFLGYIAIANDLKPVRMGTSALDSLVYSFNLHKPFYVVIVDAGSTGSRLLAFTFHSGLIDGNLILDHEFYTQTKPGLSAFADEPKKATESLAGLLEKAKAVIPKSEWQNTPLTMRATAGLRLLQKDKADGILEECKKLFDESGFLITKNSVSIMEGADEGIFAWFTLNFLFNRFSSHSAENTFAALDLGGGSTQVTFAPKELDFPLLEKHMYAINAFGQNMSIYTHSYLGMGLMAARKEILTYGMDSEKLKNENTIEIHSECINPIISKEWNYAGQNYLVKGSLKPSHIIVKTQNYAGADEDRPIVRFAECEKIIGDYVSKIDDKPIGLQEHEVCAFSYYFDRATEAGLIDPNKGGVTTVGAFQEAAKTTCAYPNTEQPFMCLDLTFISVLLQKGFGLEPSTKLFLYKKLNGHELSWALGAAFGLLSKDY